MLTLDFPLVSLNFHYFLVIFLYRSKSLKDKAGSRPKLILITSDTIANKEKPSAAWLRTSVTTSWSSFLMSNWVSMRDKTATATCRYSYLLGFFQIKPKPNQKKKNSWKLDFVTELISLFKNGNRRWISGQIFIAPHIAFLIYFKNDMRPCHGTYRINIQYLIYCVLNMNIFPHFSKSFKYFNNLLK